MPLRLRVGVTLLVLCQVCCGAPLAIQCRSSGTKVVFDLNPRLFRSSSAEVRVLTVSEFKNGQGGYPICQVHLPPNLPSVRLSSWYYGEVPADFLKSHECPELVTGKGYLFSVLGPAVYYSWTSFVMPRLPRGAAAENRGFCEETGGGERLW
jgi:hypothetical protein